jgi:hypothetical protein
MSRVRAARKRHAISEQRGDRARLRANMHHYPMLSWHVCQAVFCRLAEVADQIR